MWDSSNGLLLGISEKVKTAIEKKQRGEKLNKYEKQLLAQLNQLGIGDDI